MRVARRFVITGRVQGVSYRAWLIEQAGFKKGFRLGNAAISENHSLAIVNRGGATAAEIVELKNVIQKGVFDRFGIMLHPEPVFVGF